MVETASKSLRLSCRSELTRQGISLPSDRYSYGRRLPGLGFAASPKLKAPRDLPAPGRRQTLYVALRLLQSPVFLVNSRLDLSAAAAPGSGSESHHPRRHPFSRSYGVILPSSLTMVLPIALVFSTHPPVSVCGTGPGRLPRGFSREHGLTRFAQSLRPAPRARGTRASPGAALRAITGTSRTPPSYPPPSPHRS